MRTSCLFVRSKSHQAEAPWQLQHCISTNVLFAHVRFSPSVFQQSNTELAGPSRSQMTLCPFSTEVDPGHLALLKENATCFKGGVVFFDEFKVIRPCPVTES